MARHPDEDELHGVLRPAAAVIDCARRYPFDEALAIACSAVKSGDVTQDQLVRAADAVTSTGRAEAQRVARRASGSSGGLIAGRLHVVLVARARAARFERPRRLR